MMVDYHKVLIVLFLERLEDCQKKVINSILNMWLINKRINVRYV